ncbi:MULTISPECIES: class I SAM-dependent methyltransferase [unclassified Streptomyces]|uniref:class I SAM-dependent methyltransferase n=1 Tax=unclassified Streptomyces TaxID=2593676 RepID=UPI002DD95042|nr:class I SAM-dependent methyltransferase [Streptomyces sp. NBC_01750]WSA99145.1 class I SAM-dependent methyltransferase [Streptomyces sp. NBC_01794]WSD36290.1 class I SAM-dependent methyltransferase [Streptomyces sp. NBC_01750]
MSVTSRYKDAWEGFWSEAPGEPGAVFWDAEPALTAGPHLAVYEPHVMDPGLTLVDLGCGNGTQTRFLADRFPQVLGVDLSAAAIELARQQDKRSETRFREIDAVDGAMVAQLHAELGDTNVYMRGVLHQCDAQDRQPLADSIATLVGERGRAFVVELAEAAGQHLRTLAQASSGPPPKLKPVFRHGIQPGAVADADVAEFFRRAGLAVLASGELPLTTTEYAPDGSRIELPSKWLVLGREG